MARVSLSIDTSGSVEKPAHACTRLSVWLATQVAQGMYARGLFVAEGEQGIDAQHARTLTHGRAVVVEGERVEQRERTRGVVRLMKRKGHRRQRRSLTRRTAERLGCLLVALRGSGKAPQGL
jgi:hypothetical protein